MKVKFSNPCPNGEMLRANFLDKSKVKFKTSKNLEVVSPYDGVIETAKSNYVIIKHNVNGEKWTSIIKNFNPYVGVNQRVQQNRQLGYTIEGELSFKVSPSVDVEELITKGINYTKGFFGGDDSDDGKNDKRERVKGDDALDDILSVFLSPISFAQGALLPKTVKESVDDNTVLNEEIKKIKKLL